MFFDSCTVEREANDDAYLLQPLSKTDICETIYKEYKLKVVPEEIRVNGFSNNPSSITELGLFTIELIDTQLTIKLWVVPTV